MKNKKLLFIILSLVCSIAISFFIEIVYFNRKVITRNNIEKVQVIDTYDMIEKNGSYLTTSDSSYVILKLKSNYVNKLAFDYKSKDDFLWQIEYKNDQGIKKKIDNKSSSYIDISTRLINDKTDTIKISFKQKNIKVGNFEINNKIYINYSRVIFIILLIFTLSILIKYSKYFTKHLEKAFLLIAIVSGFLMIFVNSKVVYVSWDDQIHIKSASSLFSTKETKSSLAMQIIQEYNLTNEGTIQSREEKLAFYKSLNKIHNKTKNRVVQLNDYASRYNRIVYIPFYLGFKLANLLNFNFIFGIILAKIFNFACYCLLMYFAIKISKHTKKMIFIISLLVSNIFLATQFSYDSIVTASITLGLAAYFRLLEMKKIDYKYILIFILSIVWGSLTKAIYCPLLLLILFIPNDKFKNKKDANKFRFMIIAITLLLMSTFVLPALFGGLGGDSRGGNTSVTKQMAFIISNPLQFVKILIKFFLKSAPDLFLGSFTLCGTAYVLNSDVTNFTYLISLVYILYYIFTDPIDKKILNNKTKIIMAICFIGIWLLISTAMYLDFTEIGQSIINGVQPRYFIPILLLLLMILRPTEDNVKGDKKYSCMFCVIPFCLIMYTIFNIIITTLAI